MKTVCVLVCLLPHVIVGNIFRTQQQQQQQYPQMKTMAARPLDFIDQYQYKPSSDSDSYSQEHSKESNQDIASYIQKYIEVLKVPQKYNEQRNYQQMQNNQLNTEQYYQPSESSEQEKQQRYIKTININQQRDKQQMRNNQLISESPSEQDNQQRYIKTININQQRDNQQKHNNQLNKLNSESSSEQNNKHGYSKAININQQRNNQQMPNYQLNSESSSEQDNQQNINQQRDNQQTRNNQVNTESSSEQENRQNINQKRDNQQTRNNQLNKLNSESSSEQDNQQRYSKTININYQRDYQQRGNNQLNRLNSESSSEQDNQQRYIKKINTNQQRNNQLNNAEYYNQPRTESSEQGNKQSNVAKKYNKPSNRQVSNDEVNNQQWAKAGDSQEQLNNEQYRPRQHTIPNEISYYGDNSKEEVNDKKFRAQRLLLRSDVPTYGESINWNGVIMAAGRNSAFNEKEDIEKIFSDAYNTMRHVSEDEKKKNHEAYQVAMLAENEDAQLSATELLKKYQYSVEEHTVQTDDGYILTLFRIPPTQQTRDVQKRPVVFLMHGLLGSADDWLLMGPGKSLAYLLSDAGYDVWLGNSRGNKYSRRHVSKHPALPEFWQFSNDEIALHDLPSMIDYVLQTSQQEKLHYVGYSAGNTAFFALAAARPAYNDKIVMMYALSPMVYMTHVRSPLVKMIAPSSEFSERLYQQLGRGEFRPSVELLSTVGGAMLEKETGCKNISSNVNFVMSGVNMDELDTSLLPVIMGHLPAGASIRQMKQFGQAVASRDFRMYDFGPQMNEQVYGSRLPTKYELSSVSTPVALYFSEEDWLANPVDVARLQNELPTVSDYFQIPVKHFGSMDFLLAKSAPEVINKRIIESIQKNTTY